jgi:hypothetical protein
MKQPYRILGMRERRYLCAFVRILVPVARDAEHPMSDLARREIALVMWRWTADAVDKSTGVVKQDAFKYNVRVHVATKNARTAAAVGSAVLRHEHVVPRGELARRIIDRDLDENAIYDFLDRLCIPAIVTVDEDRRLQPRNRMPVGWDWNSGDPYERYRRSELYDDLVFPDAKAE